jgi:long-chain acyl-CoA synthetase
LGGVFAFPWAITVDGTAVMRRSLTISCREAVLNATIDDSWPLIYERSIVTSGELKARVFALATTLQRRGLTKGEMVGVSLAHGVDFIASIMAAFVTEAICVLLNPQLTDYELEHALDTSSLHLLITSATDALRPPFQSWGSESSAEPVILSRAPVSPAELRAPPCSYVIFTSGSTGRPKGVVLQESNVSANVWAVIEYLSLGPFDRSVIYTPSGYIYALSQTLTHLAASALQVAYPHGLRFPANLLMEMDRHRVTGVATNPTGLKLLTAAAMANDMKVAGVRYVMTGGQPLVGSLLSNTRRVFPGSAVINTYGCTETSARISCWACSPKAEDLTAPLPVGHPITGTRVRIVDEKGSSVADGRVGELQVRGPSLMLGYLGLAALTKERIVDGWFRTGDYGVYSDDHGLTLLGRLDDVVMVGHEKVGPEEVEAVLEAVDGVNEAAVTFEPDELTEFHLVALIVTEQNIDEIIPACKLACAQRLSSAKRPQKYVRVAGLPRNLYGKCDRGKLHKLLLDEP